MLARYVTMWLAQPMLLPLILVSAAVIGSLSYAIWGLRTELRAQNRPSEWMSEADQERGRIFDLSLDMMCAANFEGRILVANPQFEKALGWTQTELRSKHFMEFVHPDDRDGTAAEVERLQQGLHTTNFQNRALCKDNTYKLLSWRAVPDRERGIMYCVARDVTDDEQLFRTFVENSDQVVWMEDPATQRVVYVSPAYERIWGQPCISLYTNPRGWFDAIHPEDQPRIEAAWKAQQRSGMFTEEYRIRRPDGSVRWIRDRGFPIRTATGRITRLAGIAEDITDQREAAIHLRHRERLASIGTLAAGIAHEINNPLGAISLAAESALKRQWDRVAIERALRDVLEGTRRCGRIVDGVLTFAREETREKRPGELNGLVRRAVDLFARHAEQRGAIVSVALATGLPTLLLNETEIEQALLNLLDNACNAGARRVTVRTEQLGQAVWLAVDDDGTGIAEADMPHVFEPFYTTRRERGGSGLGLSITHGIVTDHDATVSVEPREEGGTRVAIQFAATGARTHRERTNG